MENILIIGAGQAAHAALLELERLEFPGRIILAGAEPHLPYERPPLSKEVLTGSSADTPESIYFRPRQDYQKEHIVFKPESNVESLDAVNKIATLGDGEQIAFDKCLIATGSTPRLLPGLAPSARVHYFRTWEDALKLRDCLTAGCRFGVIGAGFLGLELASAASALGMDTEVFERSERILPLHAPAFLSDWLLARAKANNIALHNSVENLSITEKDDEILVCYDGGKRTKFQHIAITIGSQPNDSLAKSAGLRTHPQKGGVLIDDLGRTSIEGIYAAGDCATSINPDSGTATRIESWQNANEQGRIAACAMVGKTPDKAALPWFWTDVFGANIQIYGEYEPDAIYVPKKLVNDEDVDKQLSIGVLNNRIVHAIAIDAARDLRPLRRLIEQNIEINVCNFTNPEITTRDFARNAVKEHRAKANN